MATPETMWSTPKVDGGDGVQQAAEHAAEDAGQDAGQGRRGASRKPAPKGAEDHHAFEADVDHAGPLGPQAAETGEADRRGGDDGKPPMAP